jgi:hypothetical protein
VVPYPGPIAYPGVLGVPYPGVVVGPAVGAGVVVGGRHSGVRVGVGVGLGPDVYGVMSPYGMMNEGYALYAQYAGMWQALAAQNPELFNPPAGAEGMPAPGSMELGDGMGEGLAKFNEYMKQWTALMGQFGGEFQPPAGQEGAPGAPPKTDFEQGLERMKQYMEQWNQLAKQHGGMFQPQAGQEGAQGAPPKSEFEQGLDAMKRYLEQFDAEAAKHPELFQGAAAEAAGQGNYDPRTPAMDRAIMGTGLRKALRQYDPHTPEMDRAIFGGPVQEGYAPDNRGRGQEELDRAIYGLMQQARAGAAGQPTEQQVRTPGEGKEKFDFEDPSKEPATPPPSEDSGKPRPIKK